MNQLGPFELAQYLSAGQGQNLGYSGDPFKPRDWSEPGDQRSMADVNPDFLKWVQEQGIGTNYNIDGDTQTNQPTRNGQAVGAPDVYSGINGSGFDQLMEQYLPAAILSMGAYGFMGPGGGFGGLGEAAGAAGASDAGMAALSDVASSGGLGGYGGAAAGAGGAGAGGAGAGMFGDLAALDTATQAAGGGNGLLGSIGSTLGKGAEWMKANPMLGKTLMSAGGGLLSGMGGGDNARAGGSTGPVGPPKQWNSPIGQQMPPQPAMRPPQAQQPPMPQMQYPGLLGPGQANSGAWRWLKGG